MPTDARQSQGPGQDSRPGLHTGLCLWVRIWTSGLEFQAGIGSCPTPVTCHSKPLSKENTVQSMDAALHTPGTGAPARVWWVYPSCSEWAKPGRQPCSQDAVWGGLHLQCACAHGLVLAKGCRRAPGHVQSPSRMNAAQPGPGIPAGTPRRAWAGLTTAWPCLKRLGSQPAGQGRICPPQPPGEPQEPCVLTARPRGRGLESLIQCTSLLYLGGPAGGGWKRAWTCSHRTTDDCPPK